MMEKEAPKLCNRLHSRLNSCVYPNSAKRPSSWILKLTVEQDILDWGRCSLEDLHLLAMGTERTWLSVRLTEYAPSLRCCNHMFRVPAGIRHGYCKWMDGQNRESKQRPNIMAGVEGEEQY